MDKFETKTESQSDILDPSTPLVAIASVGEATDSTALDDDGFHQKGKGESEAPIQYRLYKRRWLGIIALVRAPPRISHGRGVRLTLRRTGPLEYCQGDELGMVWRYC